MVRGHLWWEGLGQERETFQISPCGWAASSPSPIMTVCELSSPLPLAPKPGSGSQDHLSSGVVQREAGPQTQGAYCVTPPPREHRPPIVWRKLQVGSKPVIWLGLSPLCSHSSALSLTGAPSLSAQALSPSHQGDLYSGW